jgi:hypothetical protein
MMSRTQVFHAPPSFCSVERSLCRVHCDIVELQKIKAVYKSRYETMKNTQTYAKNIQFTQDF